MIERKLKKLSIPPYLSLKWKAVLILGLLLLCINAVFPIINYTGLKSQFIEQRKQQHIRFNIEITELIQQAFISLQKVGGILPSLEGMNKALNIFDAESLFEHFNVHWYPLQIEQNIDTIGFFNAHGKLVADWGQTNHLQNQPELALLAKKAIDLEQPLPLLDCRDSCIQFAVVPLLNDGLTVGAAIIGSSLADAILSFKQFTDVDVGILVKTNQNNATHPINHSDLTQANWRSRITALTDLSKNIPLIRIAAEQTSSIHDTRRGVVVQYEQRAFEIKATRFENFAIIGEGYIVTIADVTDYLAEIDAAAVQNIGTGIIGLLLSSSALLLILWQPLTRLKNTASNLPLLAERAFNDARINIKKSHHRSYLKDEIDLMSQTAIDLSYQLEDLENEVQAQTSSLADKVQELASERDFIKHLFDNAQVIIITQDKLGNILLINDYGSKTTGYTNEDLTGKSFSKTLSNINNISSHNRLLTEVALGIRQQIQLETTVTCKHGAKRNVVWLHSHLNASSNKDPVMLSVGLDITERKEAEHRLAWLADHDPLTGLFNRRRLQEEIERILEQGKRYKHTGAIFFIDLDQFKFINDTSGHQAGDTLLIEVSQKLKKLLRSSDILARLGGDEFTIVIPEIDQEDTINVAQKINEELDNIELSIGKRRHKVSASIGIALFPEHGQDTKNLLSNADLAMYRAKDAGRGRWHLFTNDEFDKERLHAHVYWKQRIENALVENRFTLLFQPILDITTDHISHYEVLLRMQDSQGNLLAPGMFIEVAERTGLIRAIDHMVLHQAFIKIAEFNLSSSIHTFSVNLSAHSFNDSELLPLIKKLLKQTQLPPEHIIFEVTETAALADLTGSRTLMHAIKKLGCQFALDDFGVGFSSFNYLKELPFDYIKIDGSFIRQIAQNYDDQILVKALCDVAKGFGKKTIAEFVETEETLNILREYQVDYAQGYHIGTPSASLVTSDEFSLNY